LFAQSLSRSQKNCERDCKILLRTKKNLEVIEMFSAAVFVAKRVDLEITTKSGSTLF
jgi:hypothetical protein